MIRSLYTGATGVKTHQTYLDVTGNNTANVNTVGYKRDAITFRDILYQSIRGESAPNGVTGGINPSGVGLGVKVGSITPVFSQGSLQATDAATDMSISGNGFFVVQNGAQTLYTRAGNFALDKNGSLLMQGNGYQVQGYAYRDVENAGGSTQRVRDDNASAINIPIGETIEARQTSLVAYRCNLNSASAPAAGYIDTSDPAAVYQSGYTASRPFTYTGGAEATTKAGVDSFFAADGRQVSGESFESFTQGIMSSNDWETSTDVYDSLGNAYTLKTVFRKAVEKPADANAEPPASGETEWDWYSYYADGDGNRLDYGEGAGTLVFGDDGLLKRTYYYDPDQLAAARTGESQAVLREVSIADGVPQDSGGAQGVTGRVGTRFPASDDVDAAEAPVSASSAALDFLGNTVRGMTGADGGPIDGVTQYSSEYTTKGYYQDGGAAGVLESWSVSQEGVIEGIYSNGQTRPIAQVALAMFANDGGLLQVGKTCFAISANSGEANVSAPMENGSGSVKGNSIEMSNVDLTEEFASLIRSQRGFQANTRIVTTSDQVLEMLINLKR
jgi:flagellar hook protein FlgE